MVDDIGIEKRRKNPVTHIFTRSWNELVEISSFLPCSDTCFISHIHKWNSVSSVSLSVLLWHSYVHVSLVSSSNDSLSRPNHVQNVAHTRTHARTQIEFRNLISRGVKWWAKSWTQHCFLLLSLSLYLIWNVSTRLTTHMTLVEMTFCHSLPFQFPRKNTKGIPILYSNWNRNRDLHQMEHEK